MFIITYKKIFLSISAIVLVLSIISISIFKLNLGIEYTGGAIIEFSVQEEIGEQQIRERIQAEYDQSFVLRTIEGGFSLQMRDVGGDVSHNVHILNVISNNDIDSIEVSKFDTIGPTLGKELRSKALVAISVVIVAVTLFIAYAFRHVSKPVSSWRYGFITLIALVHDVIIVLGIFAFLGYTQGLEIDSLFLTALLVIFGYSINDTIIVFDRVRENLANTKEHKREKEFESIIGTSLNQTFVRSINTSLTTLIVLTIIFVLTPASIHNFALALMIGVASGTYSSLFVAAPLLTYFKNKTQ